MIEADFDGNGIKDRAQIAIRKSDQARGVIVTTKGRVHLLLILSEGDEIRADHSDLKDNGLGFAKPGRWDTVCGNAFREFQEESCEDYPKSVRLRNPGILVVSNTYALLYFWDRKKEKFDVVSLRN
ncbi:hypothetical protein [Microvirga brassicacearum]|uniref:Uncharacterized protein n=1 Tax=Microvirga brassicacearum TaxID=2580413 RepID=A0A5N3PE62_9HYPH|nr:hypothetical protein [Microvirga brassicacearum]KAB0267990.1 hypothetical protein FEZ63_07255 [Microvirga brassicacearum]